MGGNSREGRRALPLYLNLSPQITIIMTSYDTTLRLYVPLLRELFKVDVHKGKQLCAIYLDNVNHLTKKERRALHRTVALYYGHADTYPCTCAVCGSECNPEEPC